MNDKWDYVCCSSSVQLCFFSSGENRKKFEVQQYEVHTFFSWQVLGKLQPIDGILLEQYNEIVYFFSIHPFSRGLDAH